MQASTEKAHQYHRYAHAQYYQFFKQVSGIRIGFNTEPDPDPALLSQCGSGSRDLMTKNCVILRVEKNHRFCKRWIYFSLGLHERRLSYKSLPCPNFVKTSPKRSFLRIELGRLGLFSRKLGLLIRAQTPKREHPALWSFLPFGNVGSRTFLRASTVCTYC